MLLSFNYVDDSWQPLEHVIRVYQQTNILYVQNKSTQAENIC